MQCCDLLFETLQFSQNSITFSQIEQYGHNQQKEDNMTKEEKLEKICADFSKLKDEQQDYILGIMQALVFAKNTQDHEPQQIAKNN